MCYTRDGQQVAHTDSVHGKEQTEERTRITVAYRAESRVVEQEAENRADQAGTPGQGAESTAKNWAGEVD